MIASHAERFPDLLPAEPACDRLDPRDAALARALTDTTVRRWRTLAFLLNTRLRRPLNQAEPGVQAALLVGAAQLLLMDRVPDHAAINESVEWTKHAVRRHASGLVNAVLRAVVALRAERDPDLAPEAALARRDALPLADGASIRLAEPVLPEDPLERLAISVGLPRWLVDRWAARHGAAMAADLAIHTLVVAPVIVNAAHARSPGALEGWPCHEAAGFLVAPHDADLRAALSDRDDAWVQDPSSADPIASLPDLAPRVVIDVCAGQGTKTRQLAHRFPDARIIASDVDPARMAALKVLAVRLPNVETCPAADLPMVHGAAADLVLLDVPCTNSGVLARRVEARHRCSQRQLDRLAGTQRQIIADSIRLLAPNAHLLYATCSIEPEECEAQARWTARWHALADHGVVARLPVGAPGDPPAAYRDGVSWVLMGGPAGRRRTR